MEQKTIYEKHYELKKDIEAMETELKRVEEQMLVEMEETTRLPFGTYAKVKRTVYSFSDEVDDMQKGIKERVKEVEKEMSVELEEKKKKEIDEGVAEVKEVVSIRFTANKDHQFKEKFIVKQ